MISGCVRQTSHYILRYPLHPEAEYAFLLESDSYPCAHGILNHLKGLLLRVTAGHASRKLLDSDEVRSIGSRTISLVYGSLGYSSMFILVLPLHFL